jgi:hypothetical protein
VGEIVNFQKDLEYARHKAKQGVRDFLQGAAAGDLNKIAESFEALELGDLAELSGFAGCESVK